VGKNGHVPPIPDARLAAFNRLMLRARQLFGAAVTEELIAPDTCRLPSFRVGELSDVNLLSGVRLSRELLPGMLDAGWGRIIFVGSESGVNIPADMTHYGVTKAGMLALSNGLAKLTRGTGVTVNTILGGPTYSDGVASTVNNIAEAQGLSTEDLKAVIIGGNKTSLLERFIEPAEIANLAVYLSSPLSSATNGAAVRADGGVLTTVL
jgi:NAD(P)-dependent dehydrogenase (short-subunit alcohol dehydrogenase family)